MKEVEREPREYMVSEPKSVSKRQKCFIIFESAGRPRKIRIHKCPLDVEGYDDLAKDGLHGREGRESHSRG